MDKIYEHADDLHVRQYIVYMDDSGDIFYDEDCTEEVEAEDCLNLFMKGVVAVSDGVYYKALSCTEEGVIVFALPEEEESSDPGPVT